jgi:hypothetical protein
VQEAARALGYIGDPRALKPLSKRLNLKKEKNMRKIVIGFLALTWVWFAWGEEPKGDKTDQEIKQAKALIKHLAAEEFGKREAADKALRKLSLVVVPVLQEASVKAREREARLRCKRIIRALVLEKEEDPVVLAKFARGEALAERYREAVPFYAKAARRFREVSKGKEGKEAAKLLSEAKAANRREKRAQTKADVGKARRRMRTGVGMGGGAGMGAVAAPACGSDEDGW